MKTEFDGLIRARASEDNPLQTIIELVLTDFLPNKNNEQVPRSEAENIIKTAKNMPLKIQYRDGKENGHAGSYPIGTLTEVWLDEIENNIKAIAVVWNEEYPKIVQYLKERFQDYYIGTSWELYYSKSQQDGDIRVLEQCVFAATVIVDNPAYGARTRIRSIAEEMNELEMLRNSLLALLQLIDENYADVVESEYERLTIETAEQGIPRLAAFIEAMKKQKGLAEQTAQEQVNNLQTQIVELQGVIEGYKLKEEQEIARAEKAKTLAERREVLKGVGIEYSDKEFLDAESFLSMLDNNAFERYVEGIKTALHRKSVSQVREIPEPITEPKRLSVKELAQELKKVN